MYLRLAFAVAAHLEPEILIVDEVLAVGDAAFQTKCLGKMEDVARRGRTVLFVSHNISAIENLCETGSRSGGGAGPLSGSHRRRGESIHRLGEPVLHCGRMRRASASRISRGTPAGRRERGRCCSLSRCWRRAPPAPFATG